LRHRQGTGYYTQLQRTYPCFADVSGRGEEAGIVTDSAPNFPPNLPIGAECVSIPVDSAGIVTDSAPN